MDWIHTEKELVVNKPIKAVLCDVDGTFIDSFRRGLHKLRIAAEEAGYEYTSELEAVAVSAWGAPLDILLAACFPQASKEEIKGMLVVFHRMDMEAPPSAVEGVHAVFDILAKAGIVFTIVTSRDSTSLEVLLKNEGLEHHFLHVAAADTVNFRKPDPRVFECTMKLLREHGIEADECLMIGDTYDDFRAGTSMGLRTVIVRTGPLFEDQHDIPVENHIASFAQLPEWLRRNNVLPTN